ncbi:MAG: hypothetical protein PHY64_06395 [Eubacteriales bacterium]|nr:hypothetical protein [Eubacteriales bacterium]
MKKHRFTLISLAAAILLACVPLTGFAQTEGESALHEYLGISFDTATPDEVAQILLEKTDGTLSAPNLTGIQYYADDIAAYSNIFGLLVEFNSNLIGINQIHLSKTGRSIWSSDSTEFEGMVAEDIGVYLDMETQLTAQYDDPDWRFFTTSGKRYGISGKARFMFPGGQWDAEKMMDVCKSDKSFYAHTAWGNVVLDLWVIWRDEGAKKSKSSLSLYYYNKLAEIDADSILELPLPVEN